MKKICLIVLAILSISCQVQIKNKEAMKKVDQEKLLKYFKKIKNKARISTISTGKKILKEAHLQNITYFTNNNTIKITNAYPSCSKELNDNMDIQSYIVKLENSKVCFWNGDTQVLKTDKVYPKLVENFMATTERLTTQRGTYNTIIRLLEGNVLVFPDGLKIDFEGFTPRRVFNDGRATLFTRLKISKNQDVKPTNISVGERIKIIKGKVITTYYSEEWKEYKVELTDISDNIYIDIKVTKNRKPEINNIKKLGKDSIVQLILERKKEIDITNFEFITVSTNHENVYVNFKNSIKYIPLNREIITDLEVPILGSVPATSLNIIRNPSGFRSKDGRKYYNPNDKENKKVIQFVFDAINKSKEIENVRYNPYDFEKNNMVIKEKNTYYYVLDVIGTRTLNYKIKKRTGEIYDITVSDRSKLPLPLKEGEEEMHDLTYYFKEQINAKSCVNTKVIKKSFIELKNNILKNSEPVIDNELGKTTATHISNNIRFIYVKDENSYLETITIFDTKLAITYNLFCYNREETNHEYSIGSKYSVYLESKMFDEQKYKDIVDHFCKNIVNEYFKKSDLPITYQSLNKMDRDALINLAKSKLDSYLIKLDEEPFDYTSIDNIRVLKNSYTFVVFFEKGFKYVPLHTAHYYGFEVFLLGNYGMGKLNSSNEIDPVIEVKGGFDYYIPSPQDLEKIAFVKKAISHKEGQNVVVREKEKHYELVYATGGEKVDKKTGKVFGSWDRIYPPSEDPLVEMFVNPCQTQKKLKKGFEHLKELILKNGIKILVDGDNYSNYRYKNFTFRNSLDKNSPMEIIYVRDLAKDAFYQIIKSNGSYQIDIRDYQQTIALQKRKAAFEHFCTHLLNLKK